MIRCGGSLNVARIVRRAARPLGASLFSGACHCTGFPEAVDFVCERPRWYFTSPDPEKSSSGSDDTFQQYQEKNRNVYATSFYGLEMGRSKDLLLELAEHRL